MQLICICRLLQDYFLDSAEGVLEQGQTLYCRVTEMDLEAGKVTATNTKTNTNAGDCVDQCQGGGGEEG